MIIGIDDGSFNDFSIENFDLDTDMSKEKSSDFNLKSFSAFSGLDLTFNIAANISNINSLEQNYSIETNTPVKVVYKNDFDLKIYDCERPVSTPIPPPYPPINPPETPIKQKKYLFSGIDPLTKQIEMWYDTDINSKGYNGKTFIQVGIEKVIYY